MKGQRKILMISDHSDPLAPLGGEEAGGQNVYVHQLASRLAQKGHTVHVLTRLNHPRSKKREKAPSGYTVFRLPLGPEGFIPKEEFARHLPAFQQQVLAHAARSAYDIVHSHYWLSGVAGIAVHKQLGIPLVHTFHSLGKVKHKALRNINKVHIAKREKAEALIVQIADCLLAESTDERRNLIRLYRADPHAITVIPAGVDTTVFHPGDQMAARRKLGIVHKHVILYVGRFVAQKGIPTLLRAYAQMRNGLSEQQKKQTLLILAGGSLDEHTEKQSQIQKKIKKSLSSLDLSSSVVITGQVENADLPSYYQAADFCVVPSRYEPFGIVPLEAMACGTPVITSFVGGMKTTVRNLYTGLHARPTISADFAHKMGILLKNPALREEFGTHAREHVEREFSWESVSDRVLTCYHAVIIHA